MGVQQIMLAQGALALPPETTVYYDALMALSPYWYLRLNDASGTTAAGEVSSRNGTYVGTGIQRGKWPLYSGGPPAVFLPAAMPRVEVVRGNLPATYAEMSFFVFIALPATPSTQFNMMATHGNGNDLPSQSWQFRRNTLAMELVTIRNGSGVDTITAANTMTPGTTMLVGFTVKSIGSGNSEVRLYKNGVDVGGGTIADVPFGVVSQGLGISNFYNTPYPEVNDAGTMSEAAFFNRAITAAEMVGLATAAGF